MRVAALLVNYRDAAGTAAAAASVRADDPATEIVVIDNSDDEVHWHALRAALPAGARALRAEGNLGFGRGCNLAMRHTDAPLLMLVNPDVRLRAGCTAALRAALAADARLAAVAPRQFLDDEGLWMLPPAWLPTALRAWATETATRSARWQPRWTRATRAESLRCWTSARVLPQRALSGGAMMVRRAALAARADGSRAGVDAPAPAPALDAVAPAPALAGVDELFDPRFFMYFEDADLCLRLRRAGWRLALAPAAHAVHAWRNAPHKAALMQQGMQRYFDKHFGDGDPWQARRASGAAAAALPSAACERLQGTRLAIDAPATDAWCLEISPHPSLWPAVGHVGRGPATLELQAVLDAVAGGGQAWLRLAGCTPGADADTTARHWRWDAAGATLNEAAAASSASAAAR
jgi:GT2 family glycosyltransferase